MIDGAAYVGVHQRRKQPLGRRLAAGESVTGRGPRSVEELWAREEVAMNVEIAGSRINLGNSGRTNLCVSFHPKVGDALDDGCAGVVDAVQHRLFGQPSFVGVVGELHTFSCIIVAALGEKLQISVGIKEAHHRNVTPRSSGDLRH